MKNRKSVILAVAAMSFMAVSLTGCGKTKVDLNKYVTIKAQGYDTMGTASYEFDTQKFEKDYAKKIKLNKKKTNSEAALMFGESEEELLLDFCVDMKLNKKSGLSNGDVITLVWDCEDVMAEEYFNADLKYSNIEYKVSDLEKVGKFDPFEFVEVEFTGTSPEGEVIITPDYSDPKAQYMSYKADRKNVKNGDTVTVSAAVSGNIQSFVEEFGALPDTAEKTYEVNGLAYYVSDVSEIPGDIMKKMEEQGKDDYSAFAAKKWRNPEEFVSMEAAGTYFLNLKEGQSKKEKNVLYIIYKVTALDHDTSEPFNYYSYIRYNNFKVEDGKCDVDLGNYEVPNTGWFGDSFKRGKLNYAGYEDLNSLNSKCIERNRDAYEASVNMN